MIPDDLRRRIIEALLRVPLAGGDDPVGRTAALLVNIPNAGVMNRNPRNARGDVILIVAQLEESYDASGNLYLVKVLETVAPDETTDGPGEGTELDRELRELKVELRRWVKGSRPKRLALDEVGQLHLFDLRRPVLTCLGTLDARVQGFVLPTPTPRLLRYFCESLRHRGAEQKVWERDHVTTSGAPLVIGPRYATAAFAIERAAKARSILATKDLIWAVHVPDAQDAQALWAGVAAAYREPPGQRFVVVFGMPPGAATPGEMVALPAPIFTERDISSWLDDIVKASSWTEAVLPRWTRAIVACCPGRPDDLPIDVVYEQLEYHRGLLADCHTEEMLSQRLAEIGD